MPQSARILVCLILFGVTLTVGAQQPAVLRNIPYTTDATGTYRADLYQPPTPGVHPALVLIHGGSWRSGHKTEMQRLGKDFAAAGYACFSIDYDTHPHSFPTSWQESRSAVAFLHAHAAEYRVDPDRIAVLGTSAGAQLAALLAVAPQGPAPLTSPTPSQNGTPAAGPGTVADPTSQTTTSIPVAAAIVFNGIYDLHPKAYLLRRYLGRPCGQIPAVCDDASPDNHIHPNAPPIFVGHGTHDRLIPYSQATTFVAMLETAHDPVTPFVATGAGHSYWRSRHWYTENLNATTAFLAQVMPSH